jgi:hypothetical protein
VDARIRFAQTKEAPFNFEARGSFGGPDAIFAASEEPIAAPCRVI